MFALTVLTLGEGTCIGWIQTSWIGCTCHQQSKLQATGIPSYRSVDEMQFSADIFLLLPRDRRATWQECPCSKM